jgi:DNA-binding transcriptional ArsR family regulator/rhodanese-related sulfurtransferase
MPSSTGKTPRVKDRLYQQFARIGKALASPHRLECLELLAQGERTVESLAADIGATLANTSQHLRVLSEVRLVERRKQGLFVYYRLADPTVFDLCTAVRQVAERRLAEMDQIVTQHFSGRAEAGSIGIEELRRRARSSDVVILDTRPANEYAAGHIAGAISIPIDVLPRQVPALPKSKTYIAYCRGPYCVYADRAVDVLRASGRRAHRLAEGFPEWRAAGYPVEITAA